MKLWKTIGKRSCQHHNGKVEHNLQSANLIMRNLHTWVVSLHLSDCPHCISTLPYTTSSLIYTLQWHNLFPSIWVKHTWIFLKDHYYLTQQLPSPVSWCWIPVRIVRPKIEEWLAFLRELRNSLSSHNCSKRCVSWLLLLYQMHHSSINTCIIFCYLNSLVPILHPYAPSQCFCYHYSSEGKKCCARTIRRHKEAEMRQHEAGVNLRAGPSSGTTIGLAHGRAAHAPFQEDVPENEVSYNHICFESILTILHVGL